MKKVIAFLITLTMLCSITVFAHPFTDVGGHWAEPHLEKAYANGMINGDPDGRFRPDDNISRGEFLKMMTAATAEWLDIPSSQIDSFDDGSHWASKYYNFALYQGWIINYSYDLSDPEYEDFVNQVRVGDLLPGNMSEDNYDLPIERWEMAYMASRYAHSLCGVSMSKKVNNSYADYNLARAIYPQTVLTHISCSYGAGIMTGDENGKLNPTAGGTRAEAAVIVNRYLDIIDKEYKTVPDTNVTYTDIPQGHPQAVITLSDERSVTLELYPEYAPQTVAHFVKMAQSGVYNQELEVMGVSKEYYPFVGSLCSFTTVNTVDKTVYGEFQNNGFTQNTLPHEKGTAVMTYMWNYNDASLNFRILAEDMPKNNGKAAAFGKVIEGMDVIEEYSANSEYAFVTSIEIK